MGEPIRIADLAGDLIQLSNRSADEIPIVYIGLRRGEKLQEEMAPDSNGILPTPHPQVMMVDARQPDSAAVRDWLQRLGAAAAMNAENITRILCELVPEYVTSRAAQLAEAPAVPVARLHIASVDN
jgi:FlaA1/EpsC-like NDP-sugar epimerase